MLTANPAASRGQGFFRELMSMGWSARGGAGRGQGRMPRRNERRKEKSAEKISLKALSQWTRAWRSESGGGVGKTGIQCSRAEVKQGAQRKPQLWAKQG